MVFYSWDLISKETSRVFVIVNILQEAKLVILFTDIFNFMVSYALFCHLKGLADGLCLGVQNTVEVFRKLDRCFVKDFLALIDTDYVLCTCPQKGFARSLRVA